MILSNRMDRILIYAHIIIEFLAGFVIIIHPDIIFKSWVIHADNMWLAKMYGVLAMIWSITLYQILTYIDHATLMRKLIIYIMVFHLVIAFLLYNVYVNLGRGDWAPILVHFVFAFMLMIYILFVNDRQKPQE